MKVQNWPRPYEPEEIAGHPASRSRYAPTNEVFARMLEQEINKHAGPIRFSAHALERLASRNIVLNEHDISRLRDAARRIEQKGGNESLIVMGSLAFVVNVKNNTVITAMHKDPNEHGKIFTNIDSALII